MPKPSRKKNKTKKAAKPSSLPNQTAVTAAPISQHLINGYYHYHPLRPYRYTGTFDGTCPHGTGRCDFIDGSLYEGEIENGLPHGKGCLCAADMSFHIYGSFKYGNLFGNAKCYIKNLDGAVFFRYEGPVNEKGLGHGIGKGWFADGIEYEGRFIKGRFAGKGKLKFPNGAVFEGKFRQNLFVSGKVTLSNGRYANGKFDERAVTTLRKYEFDDNGYPVGFQGEFKSPSKDHIDDKENASHCLAHGDESRFPHSAVTEKTFRSPPRSPLTPLKSVVNETVANPFSSPPTRSENVFGDAPERENTSDKENQQPARLPGDAIKPRELSTSNIWVVASSDYTYFGPMEAGKFHGRGCLLYDNGVTLYSEWAHGEQVGTGKLVDPDGSWYEGSVRQNRQGTWQCHGMGTRVSTDGTCAYAGNWRKDRCQEHGKMMWADGSWFEGRIADGVANGYGTWFNADGSVKHAGIFRNGKPRRTNNCFLTDDNSR